MRNEVTTALYIGRITGAVLFLSFGCLPVEAYTQLGTNLYQTDGSQLDTQAAINAILAGGTVRIPAGTFTWTGGINISKVITVMGTGPGTTIIKDNFQNGTLVSLNAAATFAGVGIEDVSAQSGGFGGGVFISVAVGATRIHDCNFVGSSGSVGKLVMYRANGGVMWNCSFSDHGNNDEGINFKIQGSGSPPASAEWSDHNYLGARDSTGLKNTYIEDVTFNNMTLQALDLDDNSRVVVRYCTFNNSGISSHGCDTSPFGLRHAELYNDTFLFSTSGSTPDGKAYPLDLNWWVFQRGGAMFVHDNVIPAISSQTWGSKSSFNLAVYSIQRASSSIPCQTEYPAYRQIGQDFDGSAYYTLGDWFWNNSGSGATVIGLDDYSPDQCGNGLKVANFVVSGRDYFVNAGAPSGYSPYIYPHPLRTGSAIPRADAPSAPQNLRVVQ
jgi:hypothetical protein